MHPSMQGQTARPKFDFPPVGIDKGYEVVELLKKIGHKHQVSVAQIALAWVMQRSFMTSLTGTTNAAYPT